MPVEGAKANQAARITVAEIASFVGATVEISGGDLILYLAWGDTARVGHFIDERGHPAARALIAADGSTINLDHALLNILPSIAEIVARPVPVPDSPATDSGLAEDGGRFYSRVDFTDFGPVMVPAGPLDAAAPVAGGFGTGPGDAEANTIFDEARATSPGLGGGPGDESGDPPAAGGGISVVGGGQADFITGTNFDDVLLGEGGDDTILAFAGDDILLGGAGADTLSPGPGKDLIEGGPDADILVLEQDGETDIVILNGPGDFGDLVSGFDATGKPGVAGDLLDVRDVLAGFAGSTLKEAVDQGYISFSADGATGSVQVLIDPDGAANADGGDDSQALVAVTLDGIVFTTVEAAIAELSDNIILTGTAGAFV